MKPGIVPLAVLLALAGCASSGVSSTEERLALYKAHSTPVESFQTARLQGRQIRWSPIGDQALMVYDDSDRPYLLELPEPCKGLAVARAISLTNTTGTVTPGSDSVRITASSGAGAAIACRIGTASRIDMDAVKAARK